MAKYVIVDGSLNHNNKLQPQGATVELSKETAAKINKNTVVVKLLSEIKAEEEEKLKSLEETEEVTEEDENIEDETEKEEEKEKPGVVKKN